MKSWQYTTASGGIERNLTLNSSTTLPTPKPDQHLVLIHATSLNPVDYKVAEVGLASRFIIPKPATPGIDFVGRMVIPASGSDLKENQLVFGTAGVLPFAAGGLAEYALVKSEGAVAVPEGLAPLDTATIGVAGLTAYQSIMPHIKPGSRVFLNGGSGGTGIFGIQIAKAAGCHVTTTCSTPNVELCKSLGADEVIDYRQQSVLEALKKQKPYDHVVDNVGNDYDFYWRCHDYTTPSAKYIMVAGSPTLSFVMFSLKSKFWPSFLGGGKRKCEGIFAQPVPGELAQIGKWMAEGKVRAVVDEKFGFEKAPDAFRRLKTGRARGKIVVESTPDSGVEKS